MTAITFSKLYIKKLLLIYIPDFLAMLVILNGSKTVFGIEHW